MRVLVIPRMIVGGAESAVLEELRAAPDSRLVITHVAGPAAAAAAATGRPVTILPAPRLGLLVEALVGAAVVHLHMLNNNPLLHLGAALSGAPRVVETQHNLIGPRLEGLSDATFLVSEAQRANLRFPGRASVLPNPVATPETLPARASRAGRPLRLLEVRRPGKEMRFTVEELLATGILDDLPLELRVAGVAEAPADPRVTHLGPVDDLGPHYAWADVLVHGSATESFGRVLYEGLGAGLTVVATPVDALRVDLSFAPILWVEALDREAQARQLRAALTAPLDAAAQRAAAARVRAVHDPRGVELRRAAILAGLRPTRRAIVAADVPAAARPAFCAAADALFEDRDVRALAAVMALPPTARAALTFLLAHLRVLKPELRLPTVLDALKILGPRPGLLAAAAELLDEAGRSAEAARLWQAARGGSA